MNVYRRKSSTRLSKSARISLNDVEALPTVVDTDIDDVSDTISLSTDSPADREKRTSDKAPINEKQTTLEDKWASIVLAIQRPIKKALLAISSCAARNPKRIGYTITLLSCVFFGIMLKIKTFESDEVKLWTPTGSLPEAHGAWVDSVTFSGDDETTKGYFFKMAVHASGENVVELEGMRRNFEALDRVRAVMGYDEFCSENGGALACPTVENSEQLCDTHGIPKDKNICDIAGVSSFFFHDATVFGTTISTEESLQQALAADVVPGQEQGFDIKNIVGFPEFDQSGELLISGKSFITTILFPRVEGNEREADKIERAAVDEVLALRDEWAADEDNPFLIEVDATSSFEEEVERGVMKDYRLVVLVGVIMALFTCAVFRKPGDALNSRCLLFLGAVYSIGRSFTFGYGLMMILGVPYTRLTQAVSFIIMAISLHDSMVIYLAYTRTDHSKPAEERVQDTLDDVALTIFRTTATSVMAFSLGCFSAVPIVRWMCLYACTTIAFDFFFQITFFVSLIIMDERRIESGRKDVFCCFKVATGDSDDEDEPAESEHKKGSPTEIHFAERLMASYADKLLTPWAKGLVLLVFAGLFAFCAYSTTKLESNFDSTSILPSDSYLISFTEALDDYSERQDVSPDIYFRFVDQSDPAIREQMEAYVDEIVELEAVKEQPSDFWVRDYNSYIKENAGKVEGLQFSEIFPMFLENSKYPSDAFVLDSNGGIEASRTKIHLDVDPSDVGALLDTLRSQRQVSAEQPINQGRGPLSFFTFDPAYYQWEFLSVTEDELRMTIFVGVVAASAMSLIFIPHWSGVLFVAPLITMIYVDILGFLQFSGVYVNGVTYITLVMSIGLLVDFVMYLAIGFFESPENGRDAKAKEVLRTKGTPVLLTGVGTLLAIIPLLMSTSGNLYTIFMAFLGIIPLGIAHGLIFLPVVLSLIGPGRPGYLPNLGQQEGTGASGNENPGGGNDVNIDNNNNNNSGANNVTPISVPNQNPSRLSTRSAVEVEC